MAVEDNSFASRERSRNRERDIPQVEKVTTGSVKVNKKPLSRKILDNLLSEKIDEVGDYIRYTVLGPGIKNLIFDMFIGGLSMAFYGDARAVSRGGRGNDRTGGGTSGRNYGGYFDDRRRDSRDPYRHRSAYDIEEVAFDYREDAERVLDVLFDELDRYGKARVADFYAAAGITTNGNYTTNYYGWYNLKDARVVPTSEGWILDLPRPESLR